MEKGPWIKFDVVDKYFAVCVVYLVLQDASQEAFGINSEFAACFVLGTNPDFIVAGYLAVNIRHAQAAFVVFLDLTFVFGYDWVDENGKRMVVFVIEVIAHYYDPQGLIDLDCGKRYTDLVLPAIFPVNGSGLHVLYYFFDLRAYDADFF